MKVLKEWENPEDLKKMETPDISFKDMSPKKMFGEIAKGLGSYFAEVGYNEKARKIMNRIFLILGPFGLMFRKQFNLALEDKTKKSSVGTKYLKY